MDILTVTRDYLPQSVHSSARHLEEGTVGTFRRTRGMRRSSHYAQKPTGNGQIVDAVSINERSVSVEDRAVQWQ